MRVCSSSSPTRKSSTAGGETELSLKSPREPLQFKTEQQRRETHESDVGCVYVLLGCQARSRWLWIPFSPVESSWILDSCSCFFSSRLVCLRGMHRGRELKFSPRCQPKDQSSSCLYSISCTALFQETGSRQTFIMFSWGKTNCVCAANTSQIKAKRYESTDLSQSPVPSFHNSCEICQRVFWRTVAVAPL